MLAIFSIAATLLLGCGIVVWVTRRKRAPTVNWISATGLAPITVGPVTYYLRDATQVTPSKGGFHFYFAQGAIAIYVTSAQLPAGFGVKS